MDADAYGGQVELVAVIVSVLSLVVALVAAGYAKNQTRAAKDQAATAAAALALQKQATHEAYDPTGALNPRFILKEPADPLNRRNLVLEFDLPRLYDLRIEPLAGDGVGWTVPEKPVAVGTPVRAHIADYAPMVKVDEKVIQHHAVRVKFWPPAPAEGKPAPWRCDCGGHQTGDSEAHWEIDIPVNVVDTSWRATPS